MVALDNYFIFTKKILERFNVLFDDEYIIAIDKPTGILVHRTPLSEDRVFLLQSLRNQLGYPLYTIHRLDRATSGVILFAKTPEVAALMNEQFKQQRVSKYYYAIVRGWIDEEGVIDYALKDEETGITSPQEALTRYTCQDRSEINEAIGLRYTTARFSLARITPLTGRRHQIRKHFSHLRHPIIGDRRHGDVKHNNYFHTHFGLNRMFLHAASLRFNHAISGEEIHITADIDKEFQKALEICNLNIDRI